MRVRARLSRVVDKGKGRVAAAAAVLAVGMAVAGALCFAQCAQSASAPVGNADEEGFCVLEVAWECEGWTQGQAGLGLFVSGEAEDGSTVSEQLAFAEPGLQTVAVPAGLYQVVPQSPRIVLSNETVCEVAGPVSCRVSSDGARRASAVVSYAVVDEALLEADAAFAADPLPEGGE